MKQRNPWLCLGVATLLLVGTASAAEKSLSIGNATGAEVTLQVTMTSDTAVEGFVLSVAYDANLAASDVRVAGSAAANDAELVVGEILTGGLTLGVVMDFDPPYDGQTIPAGTGVVAEIDLAADLAALALEPGQEAILPVEFTDGLNAPPLYNIVVAGGLSVGVTEGLALENGFVRVVGKGDDIYIVSATGAVNVNTIPVSVTADNRKPVEGFVLSITHDPALTLDAIALGADAATAEFFVPKLYANGGTFGVVMDFNAPYDGQTVPIGNGNELAIFTYSRPAVTCTQATSTTYDLKFEDNVFGTPLLANTLVEEGMSIPPNPNSGAVTFRCEPTIEPIEGITFYIGGDTPPETASSNLPCIVASSGAEAKAVLYYTSATAPIQGISMAIRFPAAIQVADLAGDGQGIVDATHIDGTITKGINAEFVSFNADNTAGELIVGILVDSTPPVPLNHMYPPRDTLGKVLNVFFYVPEGTPCNTTFALEFVDGLTGAGVVPINNRVAIFNESYPAQVEAGCLTVGGRATFIRGDCNTDQTVDIADPAATMSYLFLGVYAPACMDACDSNDDGVVDLADTVSTLRFLFKLGLELPAPGPYVPGYDPTPDIYNLDLGCVAGDPCN